MGDDKDKHILDDAHEKTAVTWSYISHDQPHSGNVIENMSPDSSIPFLLNHKNEDTDAIGSGRGEEMERALEHQAQLIGQFQAEENAQTEWERKYNENKFVTLVCILQFKRSIQDEFYRLPKFLNFQNNWEKLVKSLLIYCLCHEAIVGYVMEVSPLDISTNMFTTLKLARVKLFFKLTELHGWWFMKAIQVLSMLNFVVPKILVKAYMTLFHI